MEVDLYKYIVARNSDVLLIFHRNGSSDQRTTVVVQRWHKETMNLLKLFFSSKLMDLSDTSIVLIRTIHIYIKFH